ncbi:MAG TPA: hypothetical protein VF383_02280 [Candidatus Dormibacteraeota bacterium]
MLIWASVIGVVAGVFLDVATFLVARYGPEAGSYSYRGNGALAVPFGLGPAILAGAWVALVLRYRGFARWKEIGLAAGLVNIFLLLVSVLLLVLFNSAAYGVSTAMTFAILVWMIIAPVVAAFVPAPAKRDEPRELPGHVGAGALVAVVLVLAFFAAEAVLAPGS